VSDRRTAIFFVQRRKLVNQAPETRDALLERVKQVMRFPSVKDKRILKPELHTGQETMNHRIGSLRIGRRMQTVVSNCTISSSVAEPADARSICLYSSSYDSIGVGDWR
jgi:hypothetical protein